MPAETASNYWRRSANVLTFAVFVTFVGIGFFYPLVPLYLQEIGVTDPTSVRLWSGVIGSGQGLAFAISAPFWGILADRVGRKPMVVRAMIVSGFGIAAAAFVRDPVLLLLVVIFRGLAAAPGTAAMSLISTTVPQESLTRYVSYMQAAFVLGMSGGPVLGGLLVGIIGMQATFAIGGAISLVAGLLVLVFAEENFERPATGISRSSVLENAAAVVTGPILVLVLLQTVLWMAGNGSVPIMTLQVQDLVGTQSAAATAGIIQGLFSATAVVGIVGTPRLVARYGFQNVLLAATIGFALMFVPQGLAHNVVVLSTARMAQGIFFGLIGPSIQTLVGLSTSTDRRATVYGALATFTGAGGGIGPIALGAVAATLSLPAAFFAAALLVVPVIYLILTRLDVPSILRNSS